MGSGGGQARTTVKRGPDVPAVLTSQTTLTESVNTTSTRPLASTSSSTMRMSCRKIIDTTAHHTVPASAHDGPQRREG